MARGLLQRHESALRTTVMAALFGAGWNESPDGGPPAVAPAVVPSVRALTADRCVAGFPVMWATLGTRAAPANMFALTDRQPEAPDSDSIVGSDYSVGPWWVLPPEKLRRRLLRDFDPGRETAEEWAGTTLRAFECLIVRGESTGGFHATIPQRVIRARYEQEIFGQSPAAAARVLRRRLAEMMENPDGDSQAEVRAEVLLELMRRVKLAAGGACMMKEFATRRATVAARTCGYGFDARSAAARAASTATCVCTAKSSTTTPWRNWPCGAASTARPTGQPDRFCSETFQTWSTRRSSAPSC